MAESDVDSLELNMDSSDGEATEMRQLTQAPSAKGSLKARRKRRKEKKQNRILCGCATAVFIILVVTVLIVIPILAYNIYKLRAERDIMKASHEAEVAFMQKELEHSMVPCPRASLCPICPEDVTQGTVREAPVPAETKNFLDFERSAVRTRILAERTMLEAYYFDAPSGAPANDTLIRMLGIKPGDDSYAPGIDYVAQKMARAMVWGDSFNIGAIGSSVAAGHDNCAFDAYEAQLERQLKPIWAMAKVKFAVKNAGQGGGCGDSFRNQIWCVRTMLGDDIDVGHYSWTYFEAGSPAPQEQESFVRWLLMMPRAPAGWIFNAGGSKDNTCLEEALHGKGELAPKYGKFGFNTMCTVSGVDAHGYPGLKWGAMGDGMHNTTRYGEKEPEERKNSLGVFFRNWHPGPLGFQVTADAFAYYYTEAMLRALDLIAEIVPEHADKAMVTSKHSQLVARWPKITPLLDLKKIGVPLHCDPKFCSGPEPPGCGYYELPAFGKNSVTILKMDDEMNPFKDKFINGSKWTYFKAPDSDLIPREERSLPQCMHADHCGGWQAVGGSEAGWITFRLPRMDVGRVVVCANGSPGKSFLAANTVFVFETTTLAPREEDEVYGKCLVVQKEFPSSMTDAKGHLHLGVHIDSPTTVTISHVITF